MPSSTLRTTERTSPHVPAPSDHRRLRLILALGVAGVALLAAIFGGPVTAIVSFLTAACILQGLWRGASQILGVLVGMLVAAALCRPLGRACEGLVASVAGTTGLTNRFISVAVAALLLAALVGAGASWGLKRLWKSRQHAWMKWDHLLGGGVGLVEGAVLSLVVLWTPIMLEPIASAQASLTPQTVDAARPALARRVADWAVAVRASPLGGLATATNPAASSPTLQLLEDFIAVARDPEAMQHFLNSEPIQRLKNTPSVGDAVRRLEADPELEALLTGSPPNETPNAAATQTSTSDDASPGPPITGETIRAILSSNTLLKVLDETTVVEDLAPMTGDIGNALREAKAIITRKSLSPPGPPTPRPPGGG
jgi:hypothetical protein